jgi:hypothetical protein
MTRYALVPDTAQSDFAAADIRSTDNSANTSLYPSLETIKSVWTGKDQERCVSLCERLKEAGIPFKVAQRRRQYLLGYSNASTYPSWTLSDVSTSGSILNYSHFVYTVQT